MDKNKNAVLLTLVLIVGGIVGYYAAVLRAPFSVGSMRDSAVMMQGVGGRMSQMGDMMMSGGRMMVERGERYRDTEMIEKGRELEGSGVMMGREGESMMGQGSGMMEMMGQ